MIDTPFPWDLFFRLSRDMVRGRHCLAADAAEMTRRLRPAPLVRDVANIPLTGPLILAANHYQRRGLWIAWPGAVITDAVARRRDSPVGVHWLVTGGLRWMQWAGRGSEVPGTRRLFAAVGRTTGMTVLPLSGSAARGLALRSWLQAARGGEVVGIFPEGLSGRSEALRRPEAGFGRVMRLARDIPVLPVGIWAEDALCVRFGVPFVARGGDDVMYAIAELLPASQRGPYAVRS